MNKPKDLNQQRQEQLVQHSNSKGLNFVAQSKILKKQDTLIAVSHEKKKQSNQKRLKQNLNDFLNNNWISGLFMVITFWALFADDFRILCIKKDGDIVIFVITFIVFIIFLLELLIQSYAKDDYFLGFFFWLDLISTFSLLLDVGFISSSLIDQGNEDITAQQSGQKQDFSKYTKASRTSRVGTRAVRIVRIVRLVRLVKLYKHTKKMMDAKAEKIKAMKMGYNNQNKDSKQSGLTLNAKVNDTNKVLQAQQEEEQFFNSSNQQNEVGSNGQNQNPHPTNGSQTNNQKVNESQNDKEMMDKIFKETNVGKKLSDLTVQRLICIVIGIIFTVPIFQLNTYFSVYNAGDAGLDLLGKYSATSQTSLQQNLIKSYQDYHLSDGVRNPLLRIIQLNSNGVEKELYNRYKNTNQYYDNKNNLRNEEMKRYYYVDKVNNITFQSTFSIKTNQELDAGLGMIRTIFVCFVLTISSIYFSKDTNDLVVRPIEVMLEKVKKISNNPLEAAQIEEQETFLREQVQLDESGTVSRQVQRRKQRQEESTYETSILERTIIKIGGLLALGFGEAGSNIIAANMASGGEVNPMLPGKKTMAIFGFCDIRNFTDATEILQEDVMVFVNEIADITHSIVDQFCGAANKNIGDAFLLVWKYNEKMVVKDKDGNPSLITSRQSQQFSDLPLISFLKIMSANTLSKKLKKYRKHVKLNERMPNYRVKMGYGLHCGFGIEGSIGSVYKIDASYLSPNVNMASRLEAATKQFGVPILISGHLIKAMSPKCADECRVIDIVTVKGSNHPVEFYTCDVDFDNLETKVKIGDIDKFRQEKMTRNERKTLKFKGRMKRDMFKQELSQNSIDLHTQFFIKDNEISAMREKFSKEFYSKFSEGFKLYVDGRWGECKQVLEQMHSIHPQGQDGPSITILQTIEDNDGSAPSGWQGYRELTEK